MTVHICKTRPAFAALCAALISVTAACGADPSPEAPPQQVIHVDPLSAFDITDQKALAGWADAIFVGTVDQYLSTETPSSGGTPESQYQVSVLETLKGDLPKTVVVNQVGGVAENGDIVVVDDDTKLEAGKTYLLSARIWAEKGWFTVASQVGAVEITDPGAAQRGALVPGPDPAEPSAVQKMRGSIAGAKPFGDEATRPTIPDPASLPTDVPGGVPISPVVPISPSGPTSSAAPTPPSAAPDVPPQEGTSSTPNVGPTN